MASRFPYEYQLRLLGNDCLEGFYQGLLRPHLNPMGIRPRIGCKRLHGEGRARWWHMSWKFAIPNLGYALHNLTIILSCTIN